MSNLLDILKQRLLFKDVTSEEALTKLETSNDSAFYIGIDPTGPSLHLGHFLTFNLVKIISTHTKLKPIFVLGGFTASIGDPSGKSQERKTISKEVINQNIVNIKKQINRLCDTLHIKNFEIVNNADYYNQISIIDFFQKFGKLFNLNSMLGKEMIKNRLETGISYTEFSYQVFQAIDFLQLFEKKKTVLQVGGSDQWGNIVSGVELIRKVHSTEVVGITTELVVDKNGNKIGKTSSGKVIWLDDFENSKEKFLFFTYQYFLNLSDEETLKFIYQLTDINIEKIKVLLSQFESNRSDKVLHKELINWMFKYVFDSNEDMLIKIKNLSQKLFSNNFDNIHANELEILSSTLTKIEVDSNAGLRDVFSRNAEHGISGRQFDEFFSQQAIKCFSEVLRKKEALISELPFENNFLILSLGKKNKFILVKK